jgi:hypothetical protein
MPFGLLIEDLIFKFGLSICGFVLVSSYTTQFLDITSSYGTANVFYNLSNLLHVSQLSGLQEKKKHLNQPQIRKYTNR